MDIEIADNRSPNSELAQLASQAFLNQAAPHVSALWDGTKPHQIPNRYQRVFEIAFSLPGRQLLVAYQQQRPVGLLCYYAAKDNRLPISVQARTAVPFVAATGKQFKRFLAFQSLIAQHTPAGDLLYLGPVCVLPELQGSGIGQQLMKAFLSRPDVAGQDILLETGKAENVNFYQRFGFQIQSQAQFRGAPLWFMLKPA